MLTLIIIIIAVIIFFPLLVNILVAIGGILGYVVYGVVKLAGLLFGALFLVSWFFLSFSIGYMIAGGI